MGGAISAVVFFQHSSTEVGGDGSPGGPSWETHRPVFEQKKAKLQAFKKRLELRHSLHHLSSEGHLEALPMLEECNIRSTQACLQDPWRRTHGFMSMFEYPTDTDKHMLAMQTGLSRNQVSNWFINARVRLWKPMVEEIHTLETKGMSAMDLNSSNKKLSEAPSNKQTTGSSRGTERWHPEKKSRMENQHRMAG
ncbi:hypothetical protein HPP92_025488 [Vanilla planifolia]|uniref:Homeobox domain-containing protein n=1 Tax=Vanilla planifolia TaxID=51239 RepID=A0A835PM28_VANPL|nr:hypothetical protein HPP92_025488 [Vanilla planifolia]